MILPKVMSHSIMGARHTKNDDIALVNPEQGIFIVCDGVSEGGNGNLASALVSQLIQEKLIEANLYLKKNGAQLLGTKRLQAMQELLLNAFSDAQQALQKASQSNAAYKTASTTCITLWMDGRFAILAHIGDSRAYLYRAGKLYQITKDHTGLDELLKMGLSQDMAIKHPLAKTLSRAFGNARFNQPDLLKIEFQPKDLLFICTDGVYSALQGPSLQQFVTGMAQGQDTKSYIEKCSQQSGDDSSLIEISFPQDMRQDIPLMASDRIKLIQQTPLSKYLDYIQKSHIAAICEIELYKAGSIVLQEGTEGECMYIVAGGTLEILVKGQHLTYKRPGEFLGEVALIQSNTKRTATAVAKVDTVLLSLKKSDLHDVFKKNQDIEKHFYHAMLEMILDRMVAQGQEIVSLKGI